MFSSTLIVPPQFGPVQGRALGGGIAALLQKWTWMFGTELEMPGQRARSKGKVVGQPTVDAWGAWIVVQQL
jgi:hypothetical protein